MIKPFAAAGLLITALASNADVTSDSDVRFVEHTENPYSSLCVAALKSDKALRKAAREAKLSLRQVRRVTCNGVQIHEFAENRGLVADDTAIVNVQ